jgi:hypothetical protein
VTATQTQFLTTALGQSIRWAVATDQGFARRTAWAAVVSAERRSTNLPPTGGLHPRAAADSQLALRFPTLAAVPWLRGALSVQAVAGGAAASPPQSGLLLLYSIGRRENEAQTISVTP